MVKRKPFLLTLNLHRSSTKPLPLLDDKPLIIDVFNIEFLGETQGIGEVE